MDPLCAYWCCIYVFEMTKYIKLCNQNELSREYLTMIYVRI